MFNNFTPKPFLRSRFGAMRDWYIAVVVVVVIVTAPLGGLHGLGMDLLYTLAALCYSTVLLSSSSFLVDFLGAGFTCPKLVKSLHISTGAYLHCFWRLEAFIGSICKIWIKGVVTQRQ